MLHRYSKELRNAQCEWERRIITTNLNRINTLPGNPKTRAQFCLRETCRYPQFSNNILH